MTTTTLDASLIRIDGGTQPRAAVDIAAVDGYARHWGRRQVPARGRVLRWGRVLAGQRVPPLPRTGRRAKGEAQIEAEVRSGTRRDAVLFSVGENAEHGLRRSNEDKRRAALTLLRDDEWAGWSDHEIARRCAVSSNFVGVLRSSLSSKDSERTYTTKHGRAATMNVVNIGRRRVPVEDEAGCGEIRPAPLPDLRTEDALMPRCVGKQEVIGALVLGGGVLRSLKSDFSENSRLHNQARHRSTAKILHAGARTIRRPDADGTPSLRIAGRSDACASRRPNAGPNLIVYR